MNETTRDQPMVVECKNEVSQCDPHIGHYSNLELLKNHNVTFSFYDVGCAISIGCKTYAFSDNNVALEEFSKYVKNPTEAHEKWKN